jgi:Protein of unknown function (DUF3435)
MNHKDAGIFQAYLNEQALCNVQAAFLGRPSADALIKAASHMSRYVDPRAPTELSLRPTQVMHTSSNRSLSSRANSTCENGVLFLFHMICLEDGVLTIMPIQR